MKEQWLQGQADVVDCRKNSPLLSLLTLGVKPDRKFLVFYSFEANGQQHKGSFPSEQAMSRGSQLGVRYSSGNPDDNNLALRNTPEKTPWMFVIIALLFLAAVGRFVFVHYMQQP